MGGRDPCLLLDPSAARDQRYLMIYTRVDYPEGTNKVYRLACSGDGIHWRRDGMVTSPYRADRHCLVKDPSSGEYLLFFRGEKPFRRKFRTKDGWHRTVCFRNSPDLRNWSESVEVLAADGDDPPYTNIYSMMVFFRESMLVGIYQLHYQHAEEELVTTHLAWSYDRVTWHRRRDEFIPLGPPGQWDRFNNAVADAPLILGDTMYFYYSGRTFRHGGYEPKGTADTGPHSAGIGVATMRLDRFAGLEASFDGGSFTTKPLLWPKGKKLFLNANCRWGKIEIEMTAPKRRTPVAAVLEGQDGTQLPVKLEPPTNKSPVQFTLKLTNACVYALYWS
jgi:hypothetical protein